MMMDDYLPRIVDNKIENRLKHRGAILLEGPKWCGKTTTARKFCKSEFVISNKSVADNVREAISAGSNAVLDGEMPRLIDEWQTVPEIWDEVRNAVDKDPECRFILTGSTTPVDGSTLHSGAGRTSSVRMRAMSLSESGESDRSISLESMFSGESVDSCCDATLDDLIHMTVRGGWPSAVMDDDGGPTDVPSDYLYALIEKDMSGEMQDDQGSDGYDPIHAPNRRMQQSATKPGKRDSTTRMVLDRTMKSIARNLGTSAAASRIFEEVNGEQKLVSEKTFTKHLSSLESLFVLENLPAWNPHIRSSTQLLKKPKWHFTDPSLAAAALGIGESRLSHDLNAYGFYFESLCLRDLRIYSLALDGTVYYLTSKAGYEVDFIIELRDGRWGAVEVKLGTNEYDKAARNLLRIPEKIDTAKMGDPSFMAIVTGANLGYTREDGVHIVPIASLTV